MLLSLRTRGILSFISKMCGMTSSLRENECVRFHCQSEGGSCLAGRTGPERQSRSGNITIDTDAQVGILCKGAFFPREYTSDECYGKSLFIMARRIWEQYTTLPYWPMRDHTANTYLVMLLEGMTNKVRRGAEGSLHG